MVEGVDDRGTELLGMVGGLGSVGMTSGRGGVDKLVDLRKAGRNNALERGVMMPFRW